MKYTSNFKNIIFDFGGVIINIDYHSSIHAFHQLGIKSFEEQYSKMKQSHLFDELEMGLITPEEFRNRIRSISSESLSDQQIDNAWNAILIDLPKENVEYLEKLKANHNLFLLSNTNEIHEHAFTGMIQKKFDKNVLKEVFDKIYFSHHLKMRKPDPEIFKIVLRENNLIAEETLFVDDSPQNIEGAMKVGLQTFYFEKGMKLEDILSNEN